MKKFWLLAFASFGFAVLPSCGDDDDDYPFGADPMDYYIEALDLLYPGAPRYAEWERDHGWIVAEFDDRYGYETDVWFYPDDASWAMTHVDYDHLDELPPQVLYAFEAGRYAMWNVDDIDYYQRRDASFYVIEVEAKGEKDVTLFYYEDGTEIMALPGDAPDIRPDTPL